MRTLKSHIRSWRHKYFVPITGTGILLVLLDLILVRYYSSTTFEEVYSYTYAPFLELVFWIILVVCNAILILNTLIFLVSVFYLHWGMSMTTSDYFKFEQTDQGNFLLINIPTLVRPLLGYLKIEVELDNENLPNVTFNVNKNQSSHKIPLRHIQEFKIKAINVYIFDMIYFYKWRRKWMYDQAIVQYPVTIDEFSYRAKIDRYKHAEEQQSANKIHSPGEWLNFKDFETGDDVKRILWKIYAKNRTLMVRHRENITFDNAESHVYCGFHVSPSDSFWDNDASRNYILDVYKNILWNAVLLIKKHDQNVHVHLPEFSDILNVDEFREKLVMQNWVSSNNSLWSVQHKGVTLIIPDVMSVSVLKNILHDAHHKIYNIVIIETNQHIQSSIFRKVISKIFFKSIKTNDSEFKKIHTDHIAAHKELLISIIEQEGHIPLEVLTISEHGIR